MLQERKIRDDKIQASKNDLQKVYTNFLYENEMSNQENLNNKSKHVKGS